MCGVKYILKVIFLGFLLSGISSLRKRHQKLTNMDAVWMWCWHWPERQLQSSDWMVNVCLKSFHPSFLLTECDVTSWGTLLFCGGSFPLHGTWNMGKEKRMMMKWSQDTTREWSHLIPDTRKPYVWVFCTSKWT